MVGARRKLNNAETAIGARYSASSESRSHLFAIPLNHVGVFGVPSNGCRLPISGVLVSKLARSASDGCGVTSFFTYGHDCHGSRLNKLAITTRQTPTQPRVCSCSQEVESG